MVNGFALSVVRSRSCIWELKEALHKARGPFAGSVQFVWLHAVPFGGWILLNLGLITGLPAFDPTLVIPAMVASVDAIFLSTLILITQNRMQVLADRHADLNLQISLLAERETIRLIKMVAEIGERMQINAAQPSRAREAGLDRASATEAPVEPTPTAGVFDAAAIRNPPRPTPG